MFIRLCLVLMLTSCASIKPVNYEYYSKQSTPAIVKDHTTWALTIVDEKGLMTRNLVVEFTDTVAKTCYNQGGKKLKVLSDLPLEDESEKNEISYEFIGSILLIDLGAELCDSGRELTGVISTNGVEGTVEYKSMTGSPIIGRFYGVPVPK